VRKLSAAKLLGIPHWPIFNRAQNGSWQTSISTWNFGPRWPTPSKTATSNRYSLVRLNRNTSRKKVQLWL